MPWESAFHRAKDRRWVERRPGETQTQHEHRVLDMTLRLVERNGPQLRRDLHYCFRYNGLFSGLCAVRAMRNRLQILLDPRAEEWLERAMHERVLETSPSPGSPALGAGSPAPGAGSPAPEETRTAPLLTGPLPDPLDIPPTVPGTEPGEIC